LRGSLFACQKSEHNVRPYKNGGRLIIAPTGTAGFPAVGDAALGVPPYCDKGALFWANHGAPPYCGKGALLGANHGAPRASRPTRYLLFFLLDTKRYAPAPRHSHQDQCLEKLISSRISPLAASTMASSTLAAMQNTPMMRSIMRESIFNVMPSPSKNLCQGIIKV